MSAMQKKIMGAIRATVERSGYEFLQNENWANTGTVYVQKKDLFSSVLTFYYDFQSSYAKLQFYPGNVKPTGTCGFTDRECVNDVYFSYTDSEKIERMILWVGLALKFPIKAKAVTR